MANSSARFSFQSLTGKTFHSIDGKENREYLLKWSMRDRLRIQTFSFDQEFKVYEKDAFVRAFFQDPNVIDSLMVPTSSGKLSSLGITAESVTAQQVPSSVISMDFFDRLTANNIVRKSGLIMKCFDEFYEDFTISDELRKMLLLEDSDNYDLYSDSEREEFLFLLFRHICLGGAVCQYEDDIKPYLDLTKLLYKDLISVQKDSGDGKLHIISSVFTVTASDKTGLYFPSDTDHMQDFAYLVVDPLKRHVNIIYHKFGQCIFES